MDTVIAALALGFLIYLGLMAVAESIDRLTRRFSEVKVNVSDINLRHVPQQEP